MPNHTHAEEPRLAQTGIAGLDDILHGGLTPGRIYLVEGDPGAGKTTLALQYLLTGQARGEKGLYITLSESKGELHAAMRSHEWDPDAIEFREFVASEEGLSPESQITMFHPSEVELSETIRRITDAVEETKPARVVIDSLAELRLLSQSTVRYRRQVLAIKSFFMTRASTVLLLDDNTAEGPDNQLRSIANGVITLEQLAPEYGAERRRLRVTKFRGRTYRGGYHDYCIRTGGLEVFPRLIAAEHHTEHAPTPVPSGVTRLDALLGGGPSRGTTTLFMGPAGSGKTTVALQYAAAAAGRGEHVAIYAFDEGRNTVLNRADALDIPLREQIGSGTIALQQIDPAEMPPGEFAHLVRRAVERDNAKVVLIDSLNGYMQSMPEERYLTSHLHELFSFLNQKGVTTLITIAQAGLVGAMSSPVDASYLADGVVLFRFFEADGRVRRAISTMKKRSGSHESTIRELVIDGKGISLGEPLTNFRGVLTGVPVMTTVNPPQGGAE
jgi:circadian clock protein KaiC